MRSPGMTGRPGLSRRTPGRPGSRNACAVSPAHSKVNGIQAVSPVRRLYTSLRTDDFLHTLGHFSRPVSRGTYCAKAGVLLVVMWSAADDSAEGVTIRVTAKGRRMNGFHRLQDETGKHPEEIAGLPDGRWLVLFLLLYVRDGDFRIDELAERLGGLGFGA